VIVDAQGISTLYHAFSCRDKRFHLAGWAFGENVPPSSLILVNPDDDLIRPHSDAAARDERRGMRLKEWALAKNGGHVRNLCRRWLSVGEFCRVDLVGHFRFDAADNELVIAQAPVIALVVQLELRAPETDAILAVVSDPLPIVALEQFGQVASKSGLGTRDQRRNFVGPMDQADAHDFTSPI